jgi:hypothetical protein
MGNVRRGRKFNQPMPSLRMKHYNWDPGKNEKLKAERNISFEEIVFHIERGDEVDIFEHPNQKQYSGQKISVVLIEG